MICLIATPYNKIIPFIMFIMDPVCYLCFWHKPFILFNDSEYPLSPKYKSSSYNPIINPNGYSKIPVCYYCLIDKIYVCDLTLKSSLLAELHDFFYLKSVIKIQRWWINILYNISNPIGENFVLNKLSDDTKSKFTFHKTLHATPCA